ncbi:MAG: manganese efflux pump [Actinomycetota bacterium]|nr:manganese efflux pump [Actinomycetota bacterium]
MSWLIPLGVALTSNLDNLAAGAALGAQRRRVAAGANVVVALITALATWCAMSLGAAISHAIDRSVLNVAGAAALIAIGLASLAPTLGRNRLSDRPERVRALRVALIGGWRTRPVGAPGEAVSLAQAGGLGVALSLNNLATGLAAGAAGASTLFTTLDAAVLSFVFVALGASVGSRLARRVSDRAGGLLGGVLLVTLGVAALLGR